MRESRPSTILMSTVVPSQPSSASSLSSVSTSANLSPTIVCLTSCAKGRVTIKIAKNCHRAEINEEYNHLDNDHNTSIAACSCISRGASAIWKIFVVYLVIISLFGFVYIYTVPLYVTEKFNITVVEEQVQQVFFSVSYHRAEQVVLVQNLYPADFTETLFDLGQDLVAHKDLKNEKCYVRSAVSSQFKKEYELVKELIKTHLRLWKRPSEVIPALVLSRKVHTEVLHNVAGASIAKFCGLFRTYWLVSYEDENLLDEQRSILNVPARQITTTINSSFYRIILHQAS